MSGCSIEKEAVAIGTGWYIEIGDTVRVAEGQAPLKRPICMATVLTKTPWLL
jgi:hypothetical protein